MSANLSSLRIRRGIKADAAVLAEFGARTYAETFGWATPPAELRVHLASSYGVFQQTRELGDPEMITLLAELDGRMAGFAQVRPRFPPAFVTGEAPIEVWRFYVDSPWQGRGLAGRLMDATLGAARDLGGKTVWLSVWEQNARAIRFYEKRGFADKGAHPYFVGADRQMDRIMVLDIGAPGS